MYASAMEFLEEEHETWLPFGRSSTSGHRLDRPGHPTMPHGWSAGLARPSGGLAAAPSTWLVSWRSVVVAFEGAHGHRLADAGRWRQRRLRAQWRAMDHDEVRRLARTVPGELRGTLMMVPEARWVRDGDMMEFFFEETIEHYQDHQDELAAILADPDRQA